MLKLGLEVEMSLFPTVLLNFLIHIVQFYVSRVDSTKVGVHHWAAHPFLGSLFNVGRKVAIPVSLHSIDTLKVTNHLLLDIHVPEFKHR